MGEETPMRVLVVDDDPAMLKLIARHVVTGGYEVVEAGDGAEALRLIQEEGIPLIVTDWVMPEMDGLELCRRVRSAEGVEIAFVIVMSAYNTSEARLVEAFDAGVDDFLAKPVSPKELLARLRAGCRIVRLQQDLARRNREVHRINAESAITNGKLAEANERLHVVATIDELTGLVNRREAIKRLNTYLARSEGRDGAVSCIMLDIDHFKSFNDVHGHAIGDLVLKEVGRVLSEEEQTPKITGPVETEREKLETMAKSVGVNVEKTDDELRKMISEKMGQKKKDDSENN